MLSHQLEQNKIDGEKTIIQNPSEAQRKEHEKYEFSLHEVYGVDVLISTGEGQGREKNAKITVYKKTEDTYMLKMKTSREFFSKVSKQFGSMPFNLRSMDDEKKARMGVVECVTHKLIEPFQVLFEKEGEYVAQFKFTVLLMPNGPMKITGLPFQPELYKSEHSIEDLEIQKLLKTTASLLSHCFLSSLLLLLRSLRVGRGLQQFLYFQVLNGVFRLIQLRLERQTGYLHRSVRHQQHRELELGNILSFLFEKNLEGLYQLVCDTLHHAHSRLFLVIHTP